MKTVMIALLIFLFFGISAYAQESLWSRTYGGSNEDRGTSCQQTTDGGYIIAGYTYSFGTGQADVYLIKTNSAGDTLWTRTYGGSNWDGGFSIKQTTDGGYIVVGYTSSFGAGSNDVYLIKTDSTGDTLWTRTYGGSDKDNAWSVIQTSDGGYIVTGETQSFGAGNYDLFLVKTDADGDTLWTRTYGGGNWDRGNSVQQTTDGGYIVGGWTYTFGAGSADFYLVRTDSIGDTLWTRTYGGVSPDHGYKIQQTSDGGYIITGDSESFGAGSDDVYLIKIDSTGTVQWSKNYGGSSSDVGYSVQQTADGGYIVLGFTQSFGAGGRDVYIIKTDSTGDTLWTRVYGGIYHDGVGGSGIQHTTIDGGYIVVGSTSSFGSGDYDVMLTKLNPFGNACIGDFITSSVLDASTIVTSPPTIITSYPPIQMGTAPDTVSSSITELTTICIVLIGDANGDGQTSVSDVVFLINYLFKGGAVPDPLWAGDVNCDENISVSDVVYLINYLFKGGTAPCS